MDYFSEDSAHSSFSLNEPAESTLEDRTTRKRWARGMLAFYICLFLAGATMIGRQTATSQLAQNSMSRCILTFN
jgi:hypothetical protein